MTNPYHGRPPFTFWKQGVTEVYTVDPIVNPIFSIAKTDAIATAGSCFAQHIARTLIAGGYQYLVTEQYDALVDESDENFGVFPARFANIYTTRQLVQLWERAYNARSPKHQFVRGRTGGYIDLFRPRIQRQEFKTIEHAKADLDRHLAAVRQMFERCDIFIFTLGLTEAWQSRHDGFVYPLAPGVVTGDLNSSDFEFHNFTFGEVLNDLVKFQNLIRQVNPKVKLMFTVSPVSLIATYEDRHVLVSTVASKSVLRAAIDELVHQHPEIAYFPSFEIITGPQSKGRFYESDMREVSAEGVATVMTLFSKHYLNSEATLSELSNQELSEADMQRMAEISAVICDETAIVQ